jgi:hypothetical protein
MHLPPIIQVILGSCLTYFRYLILEIECKGNEFQAELAKVWKLNEILMKEPAKVHRNAINYNIEMVNKNTTVQSWKTAIDNQVTKNKMQFTTYHPLGVAVEILEGRLEGSKAFVYFTSNKETTAVTVVGDFKSATLSNGQLRQEVLSMVENSFNEENANLKKMSDT